MFTSIIVALIIAGLFLWAVQQLPLDGTVVQIIRVVIIVALVLWILRAVVPGFRL